MRIIFDPAKRLRRFQDRGLDFEDARLVFDRTTVELDDVRKDYGERRIICHGLPRGTPRRDRQTTRGRTRHIFSMRKANDREKVRLAPYFGV